MISNINIYIYNIIIDNLPIILCLNVNLGQHLAHAGSSWNVGSCIVPI